MKSRIVPKTKELGRKSKLVDFLRDKPFLAKPLAIVALTVSAALLAAYPVIAIKLLS